METCRPDVRPSNLDNCVEHAFSVMRLALGYEGGLPEGWQECDGVRHLEWWAPRAFPRHDVAVIVTYSYEMFAASYWEDYLLAFMYGDETEERSHMVIGSPWVFGEMRLLAVIAVSLEQKLGGK